jgi:hypothetical protein
MAQRTKWQDRYYISTQTTSISTAATFVSGQIGVLSNVFALEVTNNPHLNADPQIEDTRIAHGLAVRTVLSATRAGEYNIGRREPKVTLEFNANAYNLAPFLWSLFQTGASEGAATVYPKTCIAYTDPSCEMWMSVLRQMSASTADSHRMDGAICRQLTLEGRGQGVIKATAEMIGYDVATNVNASTALTAWANKAPLLWRNAGMSIGTYVANTPIGIDGFRVVFNNNATPIYYDDHRPTKYILGDLTVTGEIAVPWAAATVGANAQLDNFIAGTPARLRLLWGSFAGTADGDLMVEVNMRYTGATTEGDVETVTTLPFEHADDGTTVCTIVASDSVQRTIP